MLQLPVAHCELNPNELASASVKGFVAKHNVKYNLTEVRLILGGFKHATLDMWRMFSRHVVDIENNSSDKDEQVNYI